MELERNLCGDEESKRYFTSLQSTCTSSATCTSVTTSGLVIKGQPKCSITGPGNRAPKRQLISLETFKNSGITRFSRLGVVNGVLGLARYPR